MRNEKIAIVGGRGYLGQALYKHLFEQDYICWVVGRQSAVEVGGMTSASYRSSSLSLDESIAGATTVVHLATVTTPALGASNPHLDAENITFTLSLIDACVRENVRHLIYVSSGGTVYGEASRPLDEEQAANPLCSYAIAKLACENYLRLFASTSSTMVTILRVSNAYGGDQVKKGNQGVVSYLATQIAANRNILLFGNTVRDYVYIKDLLSAFSLAIDCPQQFEIYNISTGEGTSLVELTHIVARMLNKDVRLEIDKPRPYDLSYNALINEKAKSMLGWEPAYRLDEGLKEYLKELRFE